MEEIPYKLYPIKFITPTWKMLYERIEQSQMVPDELKTDWINATQFLQKELGNGFFNNCGYSHPVHHKINGGAEGQVRELIHWVNILRSLKESDSNYPLLLQKLKSKPRSRSEAMPFIEIAGRHLREGFSVYFPKENYDTRNPDIAVTYQPTDEKIFIEVSRISDSKQRADEGDQYNIFFDLIHQYGFDLPVAGKLKKQMSKEVLKGVIEKVKELKDKAWESKRLQSFTDDHISIAFVTESSFEELEPWCKANDVLKGFNGVPVDFNDTPRIIKQSRIKKEAKQIPEGKPGILYFPIQFLYMMVMDKMNTINGFVKALEDCPNIIGMVLYSEVIGGLEKECDLDFGHIYSVQKDHWHICRYVLFVENPAFVYELSAEALQAIRRAVK